jgi:hypothetical protein
MFSYASKNVFVKTKSDIDSRKCYWVPVHSCDANSKVCEGLGVFPSCDILGYLGYCAHMYVNGKMRPVETVPGMGERG